MSFDKGATIVKEEVLLEKFDERESGRVLREAILMVDGEIVETNYYDQEGKIVSTERR